MIYLHKLFPKYEGMKSQASYRIMRSVKEESPNFGGFVYKHKSYFISNTDCLYLTDTLIELHKKDLSTVERINNILDDIVFMNYRLSTDLNGYNHQDTCLILGNILPPRTYDIVPVNEEHIIEKFKEDHKKVIMRLQKAKVFHDLLS